MQVRLKKHLLFEGRFLKAGSVHELSSLPEWTWNDPELVEPQASPGADDDGGSHGNWTEDPAPARKILVHKPAGGQGGGKRPLIRKNK